MNGSTDGLRRVDPGYKAPMGQIRFSKTELLHIVAAIAVLSIAFSMVMMRGNTLVHDDPTMNIIYIVGFSFILVIFSFLVHELGHKFVAQKYNAWSEFRAYPFGLAFALIISIVAGFLFAAPGAVYIRGNIDREMNGKISLAGPAVNFVIAAIAIIICLVLTEGTLIFFIFAMLAYLNAFLGLFNMIPVLPFDGSKIIAWDLKIYIATVIIGAIEFAVVWMYILN
jgi:Zn-dependent proteases